MNIKLKKTDTRRVLTFEKFVKNINSELKWKAINEISEIFDLQEKIIAWISVEELKIQLLNQVKELRNMSVWMTNKFDSIIDRLQNIDTLLDWKNIENSIEFFDEIDKDISKIPDQRMRQLLMKKSEYFRATKLDKILIVSVRKTLKLLDDNYKIAWDSEDEINHFFDSLSIQIKKIANQTMVSSLLALLNIHKMSVLSKMDEYIPSWMEERK